MVGGTSVPQHIWRRARGPLALAPGSRAVPGGLARAPAACFNPAPARGVAYAVRTSTAPGAVYLVARRGSLRVPALVRTR